MACGGVTTRADYFVATNGNHVYPYDAWTKAATNIQAAVTAAVANAKVWVSNGVYVSAAVNSNVVTITNSLELRGFSGNPASTVINGRGANRGININLASPKVVLIDGFTITNCSIGEYAAGIRILHEGISSGTAIVQNCVIAGNTATGNVSSYGGSGLSSRGANQSAFITVVSNCTVADNSAKRDGGMVFRYAKVLMQDCRIQRNITIAGGTESGGGIQATENTEGSAIRNCLVESNTSTYAGGGIYIINGPLVENCTIQANNGAYGAGVYISGNAQTNIMRNCLISRNTASDYSAGIHIPINSRVLLQSCTIVSNAVTGGSGGFRVGGLYQMTNCTSVVHNTIIYNNYSAPTYIGSNVYIRDESSCTFSYSCIAPLQSGAGNIASDPQFASFAGADYHLARSSPCMNKGLNQSWMNGAFDLDNHSRIDRLSGIVDIGCFEYIPKGTMFTIR